MGNQAGRSQGADSAPKTPKVESRTRAITQQGGHRGLAQLHQKAGNRLVASLFETAGSHDPLEHEAERASQQITVSRVTPPALTLAPANGDGSLQPQSGGTPLPSRVQSAMEKRFAADLSQVRVHEDDSAREMSDAIGARAFTLGHHIFFNSGLGPSAGPVSHVLLAHELAHVLQQRNGGAARIQRAPKNDAFGKMPTGGNVKPASDADKRDFVKESVKFLEDMADHYDAEIRIAQLSKKSPKVSAKDILPKWKTTIEGNLKMLDAAKDAKLIADLKAAYRKMVRALVTADSMSQSTDTLRETFEKYRGDIHESGWLVGTSEPTANTLSDAIPEAERSKVKVITTTTVSESMLNLSGAFSASSKSPAPSGVNVVFSGTIPAKLQPGLIEVGKSLMQGLKPPPLFLNSTITLALDLSKFGGDYALFRFTFFQHSEVKDKKKVTEKQLLIERLGTVGMEGLRESDAALKKFKDHKFKFKSQWKSPEKDAALAATQLMADSQLSMVDGITFDRDTANPKDAGEAGHYEVETHTIKMYDRAFNESAVRFGAPGTSLTTPATYYIVHEIGHAIDRRKYRAAITGKDAADIALRRKFGQYEVLDKDKKGTGVFQNVPHDVLAEFNDLIAKSSNKFAESVVTESGERWQTNDLKDDAKAKPEFKAAGAGTRISTYSDQKWREYFAESFALYTTDAATLLRLRPKLHAFFVTNFPR